MRALVVTVVHHPEDSRIRFRQINSLLERGWEITFAAPFAAYGLQVPTGNALTCLDIPRAHGRRRVRAWRYARRTIRQHGPHNDVILIHDPELLSVLLGLDLPSVVWDVHEDTAASLAMKSWLPRVLRGPTRWLFKFVEHMAEKQLNLFLAEYAYSDRFANEHLVVPNVTRVPNTAPAPDEPRVVYVGSMTAARGIAEMVEVGRIVHARTDGELRVELIGPASSEIEHVVRAAVHDDVLDWRGVLPNDLAMSRIDGALAGLSLLHDQSNYRVSMPTKVTDYIARGVPVVTTPLPLAKQLVEDAHCGIVVPFNDPEAAADAVLTLWNDPETRRAMGKAGHAVATLHYNWTSYADIFTQELERIAASRPWSTA